MKYNMSYIVAIDGPAGSGKGTIAEGLANKLGFIHLDSGALYRCITLETIRKNINVSDVEKIVDLAEKMNVEFKQAGIVFLNNEDVTKAIRENDVNEKVSKVAKIKEVREKIELIQRKMAENNNTIMEGRDIGTTVFPNANVKFYLDADIEERAKRRYKENVEKGINSTYEEVLDILQKRDYEDSHREVSPLRKADDAIVVDSTNMSIEQVICEMEKIVKQKIAN